MPQRKKLPPAKITRRQRGRPISETNTIDQKQRILQAPARLLPRFGIEALRLRDIAAAAGVSIGTLQHYFDTRDALLRETCRWAAIERSREWSEAAAQGTDPWDRSQRMLDFIYADPQFRPRSLRWIEFCTAASRTASSHGGRRSNGSVCASRPA